MLYSVTQCGNHTSQIFWPNMIKTTSQGCQQQKSGLHIVNEDNDNNIPMRELKDHAKMLKETILKGFPDHKNQLPEALR